MICFCVFFLVFSWIHSVDSERSFKIVGDQFLMDGAPFRFISGDIHYNRVHPEYWNDRLSRIRAAGVNAVQVYVPWNLHEPFEGQFDFEGFADLPRFLELVQNNSLFVLLRPGPYICAEMDNGGLPYWLLKKEKIVLRHHNAAFLTAVENYFKVLLPKIKPYLYNHGGPVIMVQVENGYGYHSDDKPYLNFLRDLMLQHLGNDVVLYTSDRTDPVFLSQGKIDGVLPTITFPCSSREEIAAKFALQRNHSNNGPAVCSELYPGLFSIWGKSRYFLPTPTIEQLQTSMQAMWDENASFSLYMFHGGTNFGFTGGARWDGAVTTSSDFGAPISESGGITPKYLAIREWIGTLEGWQNKPLSVPENSSARAYGEVPVSRRFELMDGLSTSLVSCTDSVDPLSFEELDFPYGFVVYMTNLTVDGTVLSTPGLKDIGYVFINSQQQDSVIFNGTTSINLLSAKAGDQLQILVENMGRLSRPVDLETMGLFDNVTLDGEVLQNWTQCGVDLGDASRLVNLDKLLDQNVTLDSSKGGVYYGSFDISGPIVDTWFNPRGFQKGQVFVNGFNVGRYWGLGPQVTLYVPAPLLKRKNSVVIIELIGNTDDTDDKVIEFGSEAVYLDY